MIRFTGFDFDDTARYSEYLGKSIQIPSDLSPLKIFALRIITEENDNMDVLRGYEADLCWHKVLVGDSEYWAAPMGDWDAVDWRDVFEKNVPAGTTFRLVPEYLANLWKKKLGSAVTITEDRDSWDYILSMDRLRTRRAGRWSSSAVTAMFFRRTMSTRLRSFLLTYLMNSGNSRQRRRRT